MSHDEVLDRLQALEIKVAFMDETLVKLNEALVDKEHALQKSEQRIQALEGAVRSLANKMTQAVGEDVGKNPALDPVPHAG